MLQLIHPNQIYPKPISYYQSPHFSGERAEAVWPDLDVDKLTFLDADEHLRGRIVSQLRSIKFKRFGRLSGQYIIMEKGFIALDRDGTPIKLHCDSDDDWAHTSMFGQVENYCISDEFVSQRNKAIDNWDKIAVAGSFPVIAEPYAGKNYYHFGILFLPKIRHFADAQTTTVGVPIELLERPFQRELITMTYGQRRIVPFPEMTKVEDPILLHEPFSAAALQWLQARVGLRARKGERRIYIARRSSLVGRHHGGILENEDFCRFLEFYGFETIDFGSGEISIPQQIAMLDGAKVVMSAHGANLTNIAFAQEGISVIELLPYYWTYFSHMQIALAASLNYFGIVCHSINSNRQIVVNIETLTSALQKALEAAA